MREPAVRMVARSGRTTALSGRDGARGPAARGRVDGDDPDWVRRAEVEGGRRPGVTTDPAAELVRLNRENAELCE
jgi:transposase